MREFVSNVGLFIVLCVVFSFLTSCGGTQAGNDNTAVTVNSNSQSAGSSKSAAYPPVASGIAEGSIHLLDGTHTKLSDHKGKIVILNLWGIWCGPCRDEMPHLAAFQRQYADKGLEVFGLNIGDHEGNAESIDAIKKYAEQANIDYTLARIDGSMTNQFYLYSKQSVVPQTFLVDREGHLRGVFIGGGQSNYNKIQETLEKTINE
jgi:thiol-disulfide isomerase/thioredoxin